MNDQPASVARLRSVSDNEPVLICSIVRGEILFGIERMTAGKKRDRLARRAHDVMKRMKCEPVPPTAGDWYAIIKTVREKSGQRLDENDLWIAATAMSLNSVLVTRDSDFDGIEGLQLENWSLPS